MTLNITCCQGDITVQKVDAVVNAANSSLMGGGGVDGAIHRAGGPDILQACKEIVAEQGRCPTGQAVITTAGNLPANYVIHTVGPIWQGGDHQEPQLLSSAYRNSLLLARQHNARTVAFPSISTGAYRFPLKKAAPIALNTVKEILDAYPDDFDEIRLVLFDVHTFAAYQAALEAMTDELSENQ